MQILCNYTGVIVVDRQSAHVWRSSIRRSRVKLSQGAFRDQRADPGLRVPNQQVRLAPAADKKIALLPVRLLSWQHHLRLDTFSFWERGSPHIKARWVYKGAGVGEGCVVVEGRTIWCCQKNVSLVRPVYLPTPL
jgi:hypothetical protein